MDVTLEILPQSVFSAYLSNNAIGYGWKKPKAVKKILEVPINTEIFEIPVLTLTSFISGPLYRFTHAGEDIDAIAISLNVNETPTRYTSVNRYMRDVLVDNFSTHGLIKCLAKTKEEPNIYYATLGTVFSDDMIPLLMCSWLMQRQSITNTDGTTEIAFKQLTPIIRIDPQVYINPQDDMQKFIVKKFPFLCLTGHIFKLSDSEQRRSSCSPSIRIEESPFKIIDLPEPSINTTNKDLRHLLLGHEAEIVL